MDTIGIVIRNIILALAVLFFAAIGEGLGLSTKAKKSLHNNPFYLGHAVWLSLAIGISILGVKLYLSKHGLFVAILCCLSGFLLGATIERIVWLIVPSKRADAWIEKAVASMEYGKLKDERLHGTFRCSNCRARILESTFDNNKELCGLCASSPWKTEKRRLVAKAKGIDNPLCAKCRVSEAQRIAEFTKAEAKGMFIYMKDYPALLYCERCDKYFCARCQVDLGLNSGCPICREPID